MDRMREIMASLRKSPPSTIAGLDVIRVRDYGSLTVASRGAPAQPFSGAPHTAKKGDLVMFDLAGVPEEAIRPGAEAPFPTLSNCVAARPSGTEPKIKFYLFTAAPPLPAADLPATKELLATRLDHMERELRRLVGV
jgi:phosphoglucomutase/phosphomannomutase